MVGAAQGACAALAPFLTATPAATPPHPATAPATMGAPAGPPLTPREVAPAPAPAPPPAPAPVPAPAQQLQLPPGSKIAPSSPNGAYCYVLPNEVVDSVSRSVCWAGREIHIRLLLTNDEFCIRNHELCSENHEFCKGSSDGCRHRISLRQRNDGGYVLAVSRCGKSHCWKSDHIRLLT